MGPARKVHGPTLMTDVTQSHSPTPVKPPFNYPGSKRMLAEWIITHLPPHDTYIEPFAGSASVFFAKPPSRSEHLNDLNGRVVRLFRVLREQGAAVAAALALTPYAREEFIRAVDCQNHPDDVEFARLFIIQHQMSISGNSGAQYASGWKHNGPRTPHGGAIAQWLELPERALRVCERLREAFIECQPAEDLIARYNHPGTLLYVDPPYPRAVRTSALRLYEVDMLDDASHERLLTLLRAHAGPVVLSGYDCALYNDLLPDWHKRAAPAISQGGSARQEMLWINRAPPAAAPADLWSSS